MRVCVSYVCVCDYIPMIEIEICVQVFTKVNFRVWKQTERRENVLMIEIEMCICVCVSNGEIQNA